MIRIENLTPMLRMTDAEIDAHIEYGLRKRNQCELMREECQYERYADDWEREGDD